MVHFHRGAVLCAGLALTTVLAGCSSSGNNSNSSAPPSGRSSSPVQSSTPSGGGSLDAAAKKEITSAYRVFFDTKTPLKASMAVLQHGTKFRKTLAAESNSPSAQDITATVGSIKPQSAHVAVVTFSIMSGKSPLLPNTQGFAVLEGGKWKVAAQTFCALLTLEGTAPAFCKDPSITALPS